MAHYYQPTLSGAVAQDGGSVGWIGYHRRPRPPSGFPLLYCGNREYLLCTGMRTSCRYKRECSRLNSLTANFNICDRFHFGLPSSFCPSGLAPSGGVPFGVMSLICLHALRVCALSPPVSCPVPATNDAPTDLLHLPAFIRYPNCNNIDRGCTGDPFLQWDPSFHSNAGSPGAMITSGALYSVVGLES